MEKNSRKIYIPEQNLELITNDEFVMDTLGDMISIIGREVNYRQCINQGNLRAGIIRKTGNVDEKEQYEVVLPLTVNLLFAKFNASGGVDLVFSQDGKVQNRSIYFQEDGTLNYDDYDFLLTETEKHELQSSHKRY